MIYFTQYNINLLISFKIVVQVDLLAKGLFQRCSRVFYAVTLSPVEDMLPLFRISILIQSLLILPKTMIYKTLRSLMGELSESQAGWLISKNMRTYEILRIRRYSSKFSGD
jgi:hypothetical protein